MQDKGQVIEYPMRSAAPLNKLRVLVTAFLFLALGCGILPAQSAEEFTKIYDSYLAAVKTGTYAQVSPFLSADVCDSLATPADQTEYMEMVKQMDVVHYETQYVSVAKDGQKADVDLIVTVAVPEQAQKEQKLPPTRRGEMILKFVKEGGQWKMNSPLLLGDPDQLARPKDLNMGSRSDYAEGASTEVGGPIIKAEKQTAGTVYLLRLPSQVLAVFVPAAKASASFEPGSILVVHGAANKSDKLKVWAEDASLYVEPASQ
jgi:hypothetical protein